MWCVYSSRYFDTHVSYCGNQIEKIYTAFCDLMRIKKSKIILLKYLHYLYVRF